MSGATAAADSVKAHESEQKCGAQKKCYAKTESAENSELVGMEYALCMCESIERAWVLHTTLLRAAMTVERRHWHLTAERI